MDFFGKIPGCKMLVCIGIAAIGSILALVAGSDSTTTIDQKTKIEELLSFSKRVGLNSEGTKVVTANLVLCRLTIETRFYFPDPNPAGVKYQIIVIDLHRVGEIEQREHSGRYFLYFKPHGSGSPFRRMIELGVVERFSRWDGEQFESVENLVFVQNVPLGDSANLGSLLQKYTERNCEEGSI